jgi:hypothetical protein
MSIAWFLSKMKEAIKEGKAAAVRPIETVEAK